MENEPCDATNGCWYFRSGFTTCPGEGCVLQGRTRKYGAMTYEPGEDFPAGGIAEAIERAAALSNPHELRRLREMTGQSGYEVMDPNDMRYGTNNTRAQRWRLADQMREDAARHADGRERHWECPVCHTRMALPAERDAVLCGCELSGVAMHEVTEPPFPGTPAHDTRDDAIHAAAAQAGVPQPPADVHFTDIDVRFEAGDSQFQQGVSLAHLATLGGLSADIDVTTADGSFSGGLWQEIPTEPFQFTHEAARAMDQMTPDAAMRYIMERYGFITHDPYPERHRPEYCWSSWPPVHTDACGCPRPDPVLVPPDDCGGGS